MVETSPDGIIWTVKQPGELSGSDLNCVTWTGKQLVAAGYAESFVSTDGITWTKHTMGSGGIFTSVVWGKNQLVAVGSEERIMTSPDGITWTSRRSGKHSLQSAAWTGKQFVAGGNSSGTPFLRSTDGINWTVDSAGPTFNSIVWTGNQLVSVSNYANIVTSPDGINWTFRDWTSGDTALHREGIDLYSITWTGSHLLAVGSRNGLPRKTGGVVGAILTSRDGIKWTGQDSASWPIFSSVVSNGTGAVAVSNASGTILTSR